MTGGRRLWSWLRRHPMGTGVLVAVLLVAALIGRSGDHPTASGPSSPRSPSQSSSLSSDGRATSAVETQPADSPTSAPPPPRTSSRPTPKPRPSSPPPRGAAAAMLATLAVKGRAPMTGYSRDEFGPAWTDDNDNALGFNGCDTRNDILRRDLTGVAIKPNTSGCVVATGTLRDPYTARTIDFVRGRGTSTIVQIDHVVALADAWQKGAQRWTERRRRDLANDPLNLLAVYGPANQAKGAGDAATWLPPNKAFRCAYVARQVAVKARYGLWATAAERDAIARVLSGCPGLRAPTESGSA